MGIKVNIRCPYCKYSIPAIINADNGAISGAFHDCKYADSSSKMPILRRPEKIPDDSDFNCPTLEQIRVFEKVKLYIARIQQDI